MRMFLGVMAVAALVAVPAPAAQAAECAGRYKADAVGDANVVAAPIDEQKDGPVPDELVLPSTAPASDARADFTGLCLVVSATSRTATVRFDVVSGVQKASDLTGRTFAAKLYGGCRNIDVIYRWGSGDSADVILGGDYGLTCETPPGEALNEPYGRRLTGVTFSHAKGSNEFFVTFPLGTWFRSSLHFDEAFSLLQTDVGQLYPPSVYRARIDFLQ